MRTVFHLVVWVLCTSTAVFLVHTLTTILLKAHEYEALRWVTKGIAILSAVVMIIILTKPKGHCS
ncbi:MAG: hypothetical protein D8M22_07695 [Armatimonadetes bacterium]|nr:hypothetical protein [Armatimonadota bacterium]